MTKHRTTLKDIAIKLGTSTTTVSKALKDYPDISLATKMAVLKMAKKMNYEPDMRALALKNGKSNIIGVIIPEVAHHFFSNALDGIMKHAEKKGYKIILTSSYNSLKKERKQLKFLFNKKVDGIIVSLANETKKVKHFDILKKYEIPIVMFDKVNESFECSKVSIDDEKSAYVATKFLLDKGCKKIAHIKGPRHPLNSVSRFEGYKKALEEHNVEINPELIKECKEVTIEEGYNFTRELLTQVNKPDGIFAVTDQVGVGAIQAAQSLGIKVPEELKIIGFSDSQIATIIRPNLTTIHQPNFEIGKTAINMLIKEIELLEKVETADFEYEQQILDTYLVEREST
jgi:LacI family transcriptional regulator